MRRRGRCGRQSGADEHHAASPPSASHADPAAILYRINLTVPNLAWNFPGELGGAWFNASLIGAFTQPFHDQLRKDCPGCKWWDELRYAPRGGLSPALSAFPEASAQRALPLVSGHSQPSPARRCARPWSRGRPLTRCGGTSSSGGSRASRPSSSCRAPSRPPSAACATGRCTRPPHASWRPRCSTCTRGTCSASGRTPSCTCARCGLLCRGAHAMCGWMRTQVSPVPALNPGPFCLGPS
jgi:hypothetical protein